MINPVRGLIENTRSLAVKKEKRLSNFTWNGAEFSPSPLARDRPLARSKLVQPLKLRSARSDTVNFQPLHKQQQEAKSDLFSWANAQLDAQQAEITRLQKQLKSQSGEIVRVNALLRAALAPVTECNGYELI